LDKKKLYRRRIKRKIFWDKHRNDLITVGLIFIGVLALGGAMFCRSLEDRREAAQKEERLSKIPTGNGFSVSLCERSPESIPFYEGKDYVILNDGIPAFSLYDLQNVQGEKYQDLDALGRCRGATTMLHASMMPKEKREDIGEIKPTGWVQRKYEGIVDSTPPYLYNRCHLIAFALTGQNANERNLITGTRHFNADSMLYWELQVMEYLETSDNHLLYRVTPFFMGEELLARGVEMEAYSVEDAGKGVCFHVFVYNVQPGIELDYATGESRISE
jgi:DNA-entry nuclease